MTNKYLGLLVSLLVLLPVIAFATATQSNDIPLDVLAKIDPSLHEILNTDETVEVVIRVKPLPDYIAKTVSGKYSLAVNALKSWAETTQKPVINTVASLRGKVLSRFWLDNVILAVVPGRAVAKIASLPDVVRVFRNFEVKIIEPVLRATIDPKEFKAGQVSSWGIFKIRAPETWNLGYTGVGVRIAVLDTGVDITHPALTTKMLTVIPGDPYYPGGWMAFDSAGNPYRTTPYDTHGHGTHCSGTALGGDTSTILIGVAPGATLMHGLVLPGGGGTFAQVLAGMQWTVEPYYLDAAGNRIYTGLPAHVVSMSFGASEYYGNDLLPAIQAMLLANIVPVAAIGNNGAGTASNPGNIWGAFGIGATDINDNVATWSSGKVVTWPSPPPTWPFFDTYPSTYIKPDFSAPGVSITSSVPGGGYEAWSGTSMATPHVAGLVALMIQAAGWHITPVYDIPEKIYLVLNSTSIDFGAPGQDIRYGWGRVDAYEAVKKAMEYAKKSGVEGFVLDEVTEVPVTWASVTVLEANITVAVNATGGFKIPLDPGNYTLFISAWGYYNVILQVEVVLLNGTITGTVYNAITNVTISGAEVKVVELNLTTTTDFNGAFTVSVPPGTYNIHVTATGYSPYSTVVTVDEAEVVVLNVPLFPVGNGTIAGYVTRADTGAPLADAVVYTYVNGSVVYDFTDAAGYYELSVPSGIYTVYAYKPGFIQTNVTGVTVAPSVTTWVNFTLQPIPPVVVVLANVHYYNRPHLKLIVEELGLPVVEYTNMTKLLGDWINGVINPAVVIIDHTMPDRFTYPPAGIVLLFHQWADAVGSSLIWLGTSYSGYTGIDVLLLYNTTLVSAGYPAPLSRLIGYPSPTYVQVTMLNLTHPIFYNITPDIPPNRFYLGTGLYTDYAIYNFTDPTGRFTILGYVNDTRYTNYFGVGVAEWISNAGKPWYYLGSWAESYWMQYLESGADGMYTNKTKKVLENAILLGWSAVVGSQGSVDKSLLVQVLGRTGPMLRTHSPSIIKPYLYTVITVYMPRLPHGFITGRVVGADGAILEGALVEVLDTPIKLTTNATGQFYTWLPTGTYTIKVGAPGYRDRTLTFTVEEGVLVDLGDIILPVTLRIATLYDYTDALKAFFESKGWYARSYTNISQLTDDILAGLYHAVVYAGYYGAPFPTSTEFFRFLNATFQKGVGVIWMDSWGSYGYGIKVLNAYLNDPPSIGFSWGYPVYILVTRPHPILRGYSIGQQVLIVTYSLADFSWFTGFSGEAIADTVAGGVIRGNSIAWKVFDNGVKWALLSSFAPTSWNPPTYFTADAWNIIYNAVIWIASRPLNLTLENPYLHVGDTLKLYITNGPALTEIIIAIAGNAVGTVVTDECGNAVFTYTIPLIPGGEYLVEAYTEDYMYYGSAEFMILPKLIVIPTVVRTPGVVYLEVTGLKPYQLVHVYVDGNWLSMRRATESGAFIALLNIPLIIEGEHAIYLVDPDTGEDIVSASIYATSQLDEITNTVTNINKTLLRLEPIIIRIDGSAATILTRLGLVQVSLGEIKQLLEGNNAVLTIVSENVAVIRTDVGTIKVTLNALEPVILEIRNMTVTLHTQLGEIKTDLETIISMIKSCEEAIITEVRDGVATIKLMIANSTVTVMARLDELSSLIDESKGIIIEKIESGVATIKLELAGVETRIMARLSALEPVILRIDENAVTILTKLGTLGVNVTTVLNSLLDLNAQIIQVRDELAIIRTSIGELRIRLDTLLENLSLLNATIVTVANDVAIIETGIGLLRASIDDLMNALMKVNATITQLVIDSKGSIVAEITTSRGSILVELSAVEELIKAGLPISTTELRDIVSRLIRDTSEKIDDVGSKVDKVEGDVEQVGSLAIISLVPLIIAVGLIAYQVFLLRKIKH